MEFELDDDLASVRELAGQIFTDLGEVDRLRAAERDGSGFDEKLWRVLSEAGLVGIAVGEVHGGAGLGTLGMITLLEQQGRRVAPVPLWAVLSMAVLPLAEHGSPEQQQRWLPSLLDGSTLVTGAFDVPAGVAAVLRAELAGQGWTLHGEVPVVPAAQRAAAVLAPVLLPSGEVMVVVVPTDRAGVTVTPVHVTNHESAAALSLSGVAVGQEDVLPGDGAEITAWVRRRAQLALAALQLGVCEEALAMTARYTSERVQFGRPLSTNQAVAVRAADAYLDTESIRLTTQKAAWLMDAGQEDEARAATLVAKWWAAKGGLRAVHATQHLHGGMGADIDYPIHRYFLWGRQIAFTLGSAAAVEAELAEVLEHGGAIGSPA
ncbi:acyl-CoA dehydrogenase family protein [Rhodococcus sp. X156]|uniref:acyl-CoA dehydrogenase family protein n=1 Tax=Rhodococcus sp. X156 TaxID=2499145 RepID=UPI000FDA4A93|nr:acyl-CoA dehydrogenase family protein [Rhodococcus sp. X156]